MMNWTTLHNNPFAAIKECAEAAGKPEDYQKALEELRLSAEWDDLVFYPSVYLDDLLQEIGGATNIVVRYTPDGPKNFKFEASYDV